MMREFAHRVFHSTAVRLFVLAFVVYNLNLRSVTSLDTYPTRFLPISIIRERDLDLDEFDLLHRYPDWWESDIKDEFPYYTRFVRGHYMSTYPVVPAMLSVPIYAIPVLLGLTDIDLRVGDFTGQEIVATFLSKLSASAAVALSVAIVYLTLLQLTNARAALWTALVYAFATSSWSVSSQGLWQTAMSQPLLALALYHLVRGRRESRHVVYAGIPLALSVASRMSVIIFAAILTVYAFRYHRAQFPAFAIGPVIVGALLAAYNWFYFGTPVHAGPAVLLGLPKWDAFAGLLISPSRGLFTYSPVLIVGAAGMVAALRARRDPLLAAIGIATILTVVAYSAWDIWYGAYSYSYRFLVDLLPGLALFLGLGISHLFSTPWKAAVLGVLTIFSLGVQIIGAFSYPCGWYESPVSARIDRSRFWDWRDPEFVRCLRAGPVEPEGLKLLRSLMAK